MTLKEVGFWRIDSSDDSHGRDLHLTSVDLSWSLSSEARVVRDYVAYHGMVESYEQAYSWCRFSGCEAPRRELGCVTFTDGVFVWPEGYTHYLMRHNVKPPDDFISHVLQKFDCLETRLEHDAQSSHYATWPCRHHLLWDSCTQTAQPLPRGTRDYLKRMSTLQL